MFEETLKMEKVVGIDGCKFGWVTASYEADEVLCFKTINEVIAYYNGNSTFYIDMPVGLSSDKNICRSVEIEARKLIPTRKSSIFPVPCREVLFEEIYGNANEINRNIIGKGLSKQSFGILNKIRELDTVLLKMDALREKIKESHPELAFYFLNSERPLQYSKKTTEGHAERLSILQSLDDRSEALYKKAILTYQRKDVSRDDILDAMCLAIVGIYSNGKLLTVPKQPITDVKGIEMAIYYRQL